ncbi:MAG: rod shape-determining protein MreD [Spirochaetaceae bacterium]|nr:rod shape-determining protein MreD [Spirochaetaceae bacterium]
MVKNIIWAVVFIIIAGILQSTLIARLAGLFHLKIIPDIALCILVFSAYQNGIMTGQVTGFFSGLFLDFISQSPLGFNLFIRTVIGALAGLLCGNFILDTVFFPIVLCTAATLLKAFIIFLLHFLFSDTINAYSWTSPVLWIEIALNAAIAPFLFSFLKKFGAMLERKRTS